jgi:hypothetical protein
MTIQPTINEQIAAALGDTNGSYELLIGSHICDALGIEPTHRGRLLLAPNVSPEPIEWDRASSAKAGVERGHAAEILAALTEGP